MTRVSENSSSLAVARALNKAKKKMEDLQLKGATLKEIVRPSDNPIGNIRVLEIDSKMSDNVQYVKNADYALFNLSFTEKALEELGEVLNRVKELAISMASSTYNEVNRQHVNNEVRQLREQILSIANRRVGHRFIFGGFKTLEPPFDVNGTYLGDEGDISLEVRKDFFVKTNFHGKEVFFNEEKLDFPQNGPTGRHMASVGEDGGIFAYVDTFVLALDSNNTGMIQNLLAKFDQAAEKIVGLRTRLGALENAIVNSKNDIEKENVHFEEHKSKISDADVFKLFSDISRQKNVLQATHKSSGNLINRTLLDFLH